MQNIKLSFTKGKATIVLDGKLYSFEISSEEIAKLKDYVLAYYNKPIDFYLSRIRSIVNRCTKVKSIKKNYVAKIEKIKLVTELEGLTVKIDDLHYFKNSEYFNVVNKEVFLKNTNFKLPTDYLKLILSKQNEDLTPYINFIYNLSLNPNEHVRNHVWEWINDKGFKITQNGYIFGARWVVNKKQNNNKELADFVNSEYVKRKLQKKSPKNYTVYSDESCNYYSTENENVCKPLFQNKNNIVLGNLETLYLDNEIVFTDNHTGKDVIKLGVPCVMPREACDDSQAECSTGKHFGSLKDINNLNFGNQLITVLVNPKNIVALPHDTYRKARCCEYFPYSIITEDDVNKMLTDNNLVINDVDYESINLDEVLKSLKEKTNLYKTNSDKQKAIKDKIRSLKVNKSEEVIIDFNRIVKL